MKNTTKNTFLLTIIFIVALFSSSCNQPTLITDEQNLDSIKLEVKIIDLLPVGWGFKYRASIEKIVEGSTNIFNDTILFGITVGNDYEYLNIGDTCLIAFENSKELSETSYLPAINGIVSESNEIWLITKIDKLNSKNNRFTYVGTAAMNDGKAMFIWDFANSEAYYLDGVESWDSKYLDKKITVEGVLVQFIDGKSVIKDWKIIDP